MKIKLGVIFGGESVEHEVSIISAVQAMNKIDQEKYDIIPIYITKDGEWYTGNMLMDVEVYQFFLPKDYNFTENKTIKSFSQEIFEAIKRIESRYL